MRQLFEPVDLGPLRLRNRVVKAAAFEGMCPEGRPSGALVAHHRAVAAGGAAMCTVAYASVSPSGRTFAHQMWVHEAIGAELRAVTDAIHAEGAAASIQLGHAGCMADARLGGPVMAPSRVVNLLGLTWPRAMDERDIEQLVEQFGEAARVAKQSGFDAVEVQAGHGYLISQFLSPYTNRRRDRFGGSLGNRARLLVAVLRAVRARADGVAVTVKMNLRDGFEGGLELSEAVEVARIAEREGVDALQLSGGFASKAPWYIMRGEVPVREMAKGEPRLLRRLATRAFGGLLVRSMPMQEAYFFGMARRLRSEVDLPLMLVGGLRSRRTIDRVLSSGIDLVAMARPFIRNPAFTKQLEQQPSAESACVPCNRCVASMYHGEQRCPLRTSS